MKKYEVMAILANSLKEKDAEKYAKDGIVGKINEYKGKVTFEDFWGARGFAYMIEKEKWGYYYVAQFEVEPEKINDLTKDWNIDKKVVRFLITEVDPKSGEPKTYSDMLKAHATKEEEEKIEEEKETKAKVVAKAAAKAKAEQAEKKTQKEDTSEETPKKAATKKAEPKDNIDEKLDQILSDSSLDL